jgi:uncharacterized protein YkwD
MTRRFRKARARLGVTVAAAVAVPLLASASPTAAAQSTTEASIASELASFVNRERAARGLPHLELDGYPASVAQDWSERMRASGTLSHRPDLASRYGGYPASGENVGFTTAGSGTR